VDTVLLTSALWLTTIIQQYPFRDALADRQGPAAGGLYRARQLRAAPRPDPRWRALAFAAAVRTFLFLYSVARYHHPLGALLPVARLSPVAGRYNRGCQWLISSCSMHQ
jgi:hypothetical protein